MKQRRPHACAAVTACCNREMLDANVAMRMRPGAPANSGPRPSPTMRSLGVVPSCSALVLSLSSSSTPSSPRRASRARSGGSPCTGVESILKSPLCTITPTGVRTASAQASGIECVACTHSTSKQPRVRVSPARTVCRSLVSTRPCSRSLLRRKPSVRPVPYTGTGSRGSTYGSAPMWSS